MLCAGIDVAKDKHDCCIISSEGEVLTETSQGHYSRDKAIEIRDVARKSALASPSTL